MGGACAGLHDLDGAFENHMRYVIAVVSIHASALLCWRFMGLNEPVSPYNKDVAQYFASPAWPGGGCIPMHFAGIVVKGLHGSFRFCNYSLYNLY